MDVDDRARIDFCDLGLVFMKWVKHQGAATIAELEAGGYFEFPLGLHTVRLSLVEPAELIDRLDTSFRQQAQRKERENGV